MKLRIILYFIFSSCSCIYVLSQSFSHENISYGSTVKPSKELTNKDTTRLNMHGVSFEILGKNWIYYNIGYEFISRKNKNSFGFSTNISYHPGRSYGFSGKVIYSNLYFGGGFIYEFGKKWGFRASLNSGINIVPEMYGNKFQLAEVYNTDQPGFYYIISNVGFGPFYRTANDKWQFIILFYYNYFYSKQRGYNVNDNFTSTTSFPWFGIVIKYNFQLKNK